MIPLTVNDYDNFSHCYRLWGCLSLFIKGFCLRFGSTIYFCICPPQKTGYWKCKHHYHLLLTWLRWWTRQKASSSIPPSPLFGVLFHVPAIKHVPLLAVVEGKLIQTWSYFLQQLKRALKNNNKKTFFAQQKWNTEQFHNELTLTL